MVLVFDYTIPMLLHIVYYTVTIKQVTQSVKLDIQTKDILQIEKNTIISTHHHKLIDAKDINAMPLTSKGEESSFYKGEFGGDIVDAVDEAADVLGKTFLQIQQCPCHNGGPHSDLWEVKSIILYTM